MRISHVAAALVALSPLTFASPPTESHTNNWALLVSTSRYWFNYRHTSNVLGIYRHVKRLGIPDSNIILMMPDDVACNGRNSYAGRVFSDPGHGRELYGDGGIEVDYRGYEVSVENIIRVLTDRIPASYPASKRMLSNSQSNVFVYMTGHGGNEFLKVQDNEEISAWDLANAFEAMWVGKRYRNLFFMVDTCQANTLYSHIYSPNILATGASKLNQSSYSHENDPSLGVHVIDKYTLHILNYLEGVNKTSDATMADLFGSYDPKTIGSDPGVRNDLGRNLAEVKVTEFFGGVTRAQILTDEEDDL